MYIVEKRKYMDKVNCILLVNKYIYRNVNLNTYILHNYNECICVCAWKHHIFQFQTLLIVEEQKYMYKVDGMLFESENIQH